MKDIHEELEDAEQTIDELLEALENIRMTADQSGLDCQLTYDGVLEDICEAATEAIRKAKADLPGGGKR